MPTSTQGNLFKNLTYVDEIKSQIVNSGATVVFMKDNIIVASEISEEQYRKLIDNPYVEKIDVLPLKRYKDEGVIRYELDPDVFRDENVEDIKIITSNENKFTE